MGFFFAQGCLAQSYYVQLKLMGSYHVGPMASYVATMKEGEGKKSSFV